MGELISNRISLRAVCLIALIVFALLSGSTLAQEVVPTKKHLIQALREIDGHLEKGDLLNAAKWVVMPPTMGPEDLGSLKRLQEISAAGIARLEVEAKFGTAIEIFGEQRANHFANKMKADVSLCYGMNHRVGDVAAEVIGQWDTDHFLLVRIDDIGKLPAALVETEYKATKANPSLPSFAGAPYPLAVPSESPNYQAIAAKIGALGQAVTSNPDDLAARATYAKALFVIKNYPMAWQQLMAAYKLDPKHLGVQAGVDALMDALTAQGVFGANVPRATIEGLLGEPRTKVDLNERDRYVYAHWAIDFEDDRVREIIDLRGASEAWFMPKETVTVELDGRMWNTGFRKKQNGVVLALLYVPGESVAKCKEQIAVERIVDGIRIGSSKLVFEKLIRDQRKSHPGAQFKVLEEDEGSFLFASTLPARNDGEQSRHQLVKVFRGANDLHRLTYTVLQKAPPTQEVQMKWKGIFEKAFLEKTNLKLKNAKSEPTNESSAPKAADETTPVRSPGG